MFLVIILGVVMSLFIWVKVLAAAVTAAVALAIAALFDVPLDKMFLTRLFIVFELDETLEEPCREILEPLTLTLRGLGILRVPILTWSAFWVVWVLFNEKLLIEGVSDGDDEFKTVIPGLFVPGWFVIFVNWVRLRFVVGEAGVVVDLIIFFGPESVNVDGTWASGPVEGDCCDIWIWILPLVVVEAVDYKIKQF